jgi:hypothetical protein
MVVRGAVAVSLVAVLCGCGIMPGSEPTAASSDDCTGSIRLHGVVYVFDSRINQAAPQGRSIGPGAVVDCDHRTVVDRVVVSAVKGADSHVAIRVPAGNWHGVYVAENLPHAQWPAVLRAR